MNLKLSSPARSVIRATSPRAAAGSRYSSTYLTGEASSGEPIAFLDARREQRLELVVIAPTHHPQRRQGRRGLLRVDLRHREADVDQHPVADRDALVLEQADVDRPP